jgi:hypothetical protein
MSFYDAIYILYEHIKLSASENDLWSLINNEQNHLKNLYYYKRIDGNFKIVSTKIFINMVINIRNYT